MATVVFKANVFSLGDRVKLGRNTLVLLRSIVFCLFVLVLVF